MNSNNWNGQYEGQSSNIRSESVASSSSVSGCSSLPSGPPRPLVPKFRSLLDLERNIDHGQAESLKIMRLGHRDRHRLLTGPRDYFYRNFLLPTAGRAFLIQLWTSVFLLACWTGIASLLDIFFAHTYLKTEKTFLQDLGDHLRFSAFFKHWILLGAFLVAVASNWNYLWLVKIPPPLFPTRTHKLVEFLRCLALNGPAALIGLAMVSLRPVHSVRIAAERDQIAQSGEGSVLITEVPSAWDFVWWEMVLKIVAPVLYIFACFISSNFVHFWMGDFFIGVVKTEHLKPSLLFIQNPVVFVKQLFSTLISTTTTAFYPVLVYPGRNFWQTTAALFFLPILFPLTDLCRLWIQYKFLAFAVIHTWNLNLLQMRTSLASLHRFGDLDFADWIALPDVLGELRRSGWWWIDYLEMQLRAAFVEQLKNQPTILSSFLHMRMSTRDLSQLDQFIRFWLQPIVEFSRQFHTVKFLVDEQEDPRSRRMDFLFWTARQLQVLHEHYSQKYSPNLLDQDFTAYPFALVAQPSVRTIEHIRGVCLLATRAKAVDTRNVLASNYSHILEQVTALSVILKNGGKKFEDLTDGRLFQQFPNMEPCIRFYVKSFRQLEHLTKLNLTELVDALAKDTSELRFDEFPELKPYVDHLIQQTKER